MASKAKIEALAGTPEGSMLPTPKDSAEVRRLKAELRESGERCSRHRVRRLMKAEGIRAEIGYGTKPRHRGGPPRVVENVVNWGFSPAAPNRVWVTDITYIRTYEGWLFLAVIVDLYSRQVVGWAMQSQMTADLVLQTLVSVVWKRKPAAGLIIHSGQGSQFTSSDWLSLLKQHGMVPSMSRRGNCHDNAVAESFFSPLKQKANQATDLPDPGRGTPGCTQLNRDVLQPNPTPWFR